MPSTIAILKPKHVIFRSKGCRTCRARKVKCDETRPVCQRCIRSKYDCQGYSEPTTFLSDNPRVQASIPVAESIRASPAQFISSVPQALPYPAELTYIAFLVRKFSIGTPGDRRGFSWLRIGLEAPDQNSLFSVATRCLAEVYYGRVFRQEGIVINGIAKYGSILGHLRQQLQVPGSFYINNLMSVIMTAIIIESVSNQSRVGLLAHVSGLAQIVQQAGPQAFQQRPNVLIFGMFRCFFIAKAIKGKQMTFVSEPEWKTIPWAHEEKTFGVKLWDILCDIPSLTSDLKYLQYPAGGKTVEESLRFASSPLYMKFTSIFQNLFEWRWKWERQYSSSVGEVLVTPSKPLTNASGTLWYPTVIHFSSRWRATEIIYYNATLIYLLRTARQLHWNFLTESTNKGAPPEIVQPLPPSLLILPQDMWSIEDAFSEFYRSVEGCLCTATEDAGDWYQLIFALVLVEAHLDNDSLEATWMRGVRKRIITTSRLDMWSAAYRSV